MNPKWLVVGWIIIDSGLITSQKIRFIWIKSIYVYTVCWDSLSLLCLPQYHQRQFQQWQCTIALVMKLYKIQHHRLNSHILLILIVYTSIYYTNTTVFILRMKLHLPADNSAWGSRCQREAAQRPSRTPVELGSGWILHVMYTGIYRYI
jgi:hypothetical protein